MLPKSTKVLIVGAGPAGLATAISLFKSGVKNITIVDAQESGQNTSRAILVHAQTLEDLYSLGCAEKLVERGTHAQHAIINVGQKPLMKANFDNLKDRTQFPYALIISQSETEKALLDTLKTFGVEVLRPFRVAKLETEAPDGIKVLFETGEIVKAEYIIGADGSHSTIRQAAEIPFKDPLNDQDPHAVPKEKHLTLDSDKLGLNLIIADVYLSSQASKFVNSNSINLYLGPLGLLLIVALPPAKEDPNKLIYRLVCPQDKGATTVSLKHLQKAMDDGLGLPKGEVPTVETILWSSQFRTNWAIADTFYRRLGGGVILCPAGGQGMNLGIRDGIYLGRVLASVVEFEKSEASPEAIKDFSEKALTTFSHERRNLAMKIIKMTRIMTRVVGLKTVAARSTRNIVFKIVGATSLVRNRFALQLSGLQQG